MSLEPHKLIVKVFLLNNKDISHEPQELGCDYPPIERSPV